MKNLLITFLIIGRLGAWGQVFADDFSDPDLSSDPAWTGDVGQFIVNPDEQLQLDDTAAGQRFLATTYSEVSTSEKEWNLWVKQTFSGSDNNQSRFYLVSDGNTFNYSGSGSAGVHGYFLKFGETGSTDAIRLYRDDGTGNVVELGAGTAGLVAASFEIRLKVITDENGLWTIYADATGGTDYAFEFSVTDNTYALTSSTGLVCTYTSSNADNFYFDDIYFGNVIVDSDPPVIISATAVSGSSLDVLFSEGVDITTAENISNYNVPGIGSPSVASVDGDVAALVHLNFTGTFPLNEMLLLETVGITDYAGNLIIPSTTEFMYTIPTNGYSRAVVFNEILADPTPVIGLPEVEFIELHNPTTDTFNLSEWQLFNNTTAKSLPEYLLMPGDHVILCEDDFAALFPQAIGIASFPALTNGGDSLTLTDNIGTVIDILVYSIVWYETPEKAEGGWSLEQINPLLPCQSSSNWSETTDPAGGTPGVQNSVYDPTPDTTSPETENVSVLSPTTIEILFSETMDSTSFDEGDINIAGIPISGTEWNNTASGILITLSNALTEGVEYDITLSSLSDCSGNEMVLFSGQIILGYIPEPGDIIINEILAAPGTNDEEFIELYNRSNLILDLRTTAINGAVFEEQIIVEPGAYIVVTDPSNLFAFEGIENIYFLDGFPGLTNTGMLLELTDAAANILDRVDYNEAWYHDPEKMDGGFSFERINPDDPCSDEDNWRASVAFLGSTPGEINSVFSTAPDTAPPALLYVYLQPQESVTLEFDEPLDETLLSDLSWLVNGELISNANPAIDPTEPRQLILHYGEMETDVIYNFELDGVMDCWGNSVAVIGTFATGEEFSAGDIIINEVLSHPFDNGEDFVEIFNRSGKNINLKGWKISGLYNGSISDLSVITSKELVLLSGQFLALTPSTESVITFYPLARESGLWGMEEFPSLNNDEGTVVLFTPGDEISDQFTYSSEMHFPLLNSTEGISLERVDPWRDTGDPTNWHSAAESVGFATPGYMNSQASLAGIQQGEFVVVPEIFSPDNDGHEDVVTFSYKLEGPGYVGNLHIYDDAGRQVRHLMRNELLGLSGSISWDGISDDGGLLPIGIYVIYFEVFNTDGGKTGVKETCVLAHRLN